MARRGSATARQGPGLGSSDGRYSRLRNADQPRRSGEGGAMRMTGARLRITGSGPEQGMATRRLKGLVVA